MARQDASEAPPLRISNLVKRFPDVVAVNDVCLEIRPGEIFALLGPNGAGKTTLIHCVAGLARQSSGSIEVFGYDTRRAFRRTRRLVGLVPQEIMFDPFFTPFESLMIQMGLMGMEPDREWAEELLAMFSLSDRRDAYTRNLSGGMKRRLLVAKALVHRPRLIFLDEPTAGVDVQLRQELWSNVRKLRDQGATIVLTTHYLEEAEELADRVGVVHHGKLIIVEETAALMRRFEQNRVILSYERDLDGVPPGLPPSSELLGGSRVSVPWSDAHELRQVLAAATKGGSCPQVSVEHTALEDIFVELIDAADRESKAGGGR